MNFIKKLIKVILFVKPSKITILTEIPLQEKKFNTQEITDLNPGTIINGLFIGSIKFPKEGVFLTPNDILSVPEGTILMGDIRTDTGIISLESKTLILGKLIQLSLSKDSVESSLEFNVSSFTPSVFIEEMVAVIYYPTIFTGIVMPSQSFLENYSFNEALEAKNLRINFQLLFLTIILNFILFLSFIYIYLNNNENIDALTTMISTLMLGITSFYMILKPENIKPHFEINLTFTLIIDFILIGIFGYFYYIKIKNLSNIMSIIAVMMAEMTLFFINFRKN
jgi:hypothetical protein